MQENGTEKKIEIGNYILQKLKEKGRSVAWLAKQLKCDKSNLNKTLKTNSKYISYDFIFRVSQVIGEDIFMYGSQELEKTKK